MFHNSRQQRIHCAIALVACLLCATIAQAKKPQKPPADCGGGTIYYVDKQSGAATMNCDGTATTLLPDNVFGEPSLATHGGHRWFLDVRPIPGDNYPDGGQRVEVFAVRDDGDETLTVQLTDDPNLELIPGQHIARWTADTVEDQTVVDGSVGWVARRWDGLTALPVESGIYSMPVFFDADGNIIDPVGLFAPTLIVAGGFINDGSATPPADIGDFDFAPSGTALVYEQKGNGLFVVDLLTDDSWQVTGDGRDPNWSPDGSGIAFETTWSSGRKSFSSIDIVSPDGANRDMLVSVQFTSGFKSLYRPSWSPSASHLIYGYISQSKRTGNLIQDIYRVASEGSGATNLTDDVGNSFVVAWR